MTTTTKETMPSNVVQELRDFLDKDPAFKADFEKAVEKANASKVPGIPKTLADYLDYYESFLKWVPSENEDGTCVFNHICRFYLVLDLCPLILHQSPILPSTVPPYSWLSKWIIRYAKEMGKWMDSTESISEEKIDTFYRAEKYHMQDYDRIPGQWTTFNKFFARHIKPECRPISYPKDNTVIVSPADATFDSWWPVDGSGSCNLKGIPWSIEQLLDDRGNSMWSTFADGKFCHSFLGPHDYHRLHAPVSGRVAQARLIEGLCYLEVAVTNVNEDGTYSSSPRLTMRRKLNPVIAEPTDGSDPGVEVPNTAGYQFIQARALILIKTLDLGLVAVLPIGMAQVSSVVLSVQEGDDIKKGDEIAYFQLGGSDVVMVFQPGANVEFTAKPDQFCAFGTQVAVASPANRL